MFVMIKNSLPALSNISNSHWSPPYQYGHASLTLVTHVWFTLILSIMIWGSSLFATIGHLYPLADLNHILSFFSFLFDEDSKNISTYVCILLF